ncbi:dUTP diphosphatase [Sediminibacterium sp.]|jgi:dUTP pyrophosphatase|uniref:dUTP diphosphatase n=1 Tax=Sediminibacterium sp. TaxID=1917865 RepID=UPI0025DB22EC|nr:dUTP diphosphatase [Sediminibacterium sp.]
MSEMSIRVRIVNASQNPLPVYATVGSSGVDIRAHLEQAITIKPSERMLVPTGIFLEIPLGYEIQIRPRSGLAIKQGITCLNTPGTIDADYRGEVKVILINLSSEEQTIQPGDRIAQMVLQKVERIEWEATDTLDETERGTGGFGSTGRI